MCVCVCERKREVNNRVFSPVGDGRIRRVEVSKDRCLIVLVKNRNFRAKGRARTSWFTWTQWNGWGDWYTGSSRIASK